MILSRHLCRQYALSLLASTGLFTGTYVVIDLVLHLSAFMEIEPARFLVHAFLFYLNLAPFILYYLLPALGLATALLTTTLLHRGRQWDTLRFTGYDVRRAFLFLCLLSTIFVPFGAVLQEVALPSLTDRFLTFGAERNRWNIPRENLTLFAEPDSMVILQRYDARKRAFQGCWVLRFDTSRSLDRQVYAAEGTWIGDGGSLMSGRWQVPGGVLLLTEGGAGLDPPGAGEERLPFSPADIEFMKSRWSFISTSRLIGLMREGRGGTETEAEIWMRFLYPLQAFFLSVIGCGFLLSLRRPASLTVAGVLLPGYGLFYVLANSLFMLSARGHLPAVAGVGIPVILLAGLAGFLFKRLYR